MFARADEFRGRAGARRHNRFRMRHGLQKNNSESFPLGPLGTVAIQLRAGRHGKNAAAIVSGMQFVSGKRAREAHRVRDALLLCARLKVGPVIAIAHDPVLRIRHAAKNGRPRFEHHVMALISFRRGEASHG